VNNARYYGLLSSGGHLNRRRFEAMRGRTALLCRRVVDAGQVHIGIGRLDSRKSVQVWDLAAIPRIVLEKSRFRKVAAGGYKSCVTLELYLE
jgi:hypothetical protein